jgi:hypothetical protein
MDVVKSLLLLLVLLVLVIAAIHLLYELSMDMWTDDGDDDYWDYKS